MAGTIPDGPLASAAVIIGDEHVLIREGLRMLLSREPDLVVAGEAADFAELLSLIAARRPDVVVMDAGMPGTGGALETLKHLRTRWPRLPVVALSAAPEPQAGLDFLIAGATGYLSKDAAAEEVVAAIRGAARGERTLGATLSQRFRRERLQPDEGLSPREQEVL